MMTLNSRACCLCLLNFGITGMHYYGFVIIIIIFFFFGK